MTAGPHADMPGGDDRFVIELEFVQSLANPDYVSHLLQLHGEDEHFWRFLHYLQYWQRPAYRAFISYCCAFCDLQGIRYACSCSSCS